MMNNSDTTIVSRPGTSAWAMLALLLVFCGGFLLIAIFDSPQPSDKWGWLFIVGACFLGVLSMLLYIVRHRIIADQNGLRWRGAWTSWKRARWDEVSDFYQSAPGGNAALRVVETRQGKLSFSNLDSAREALDNCIAERARAAAFESWQIKGLRANEPFEQRFAARTISTRAFVLTFGVLLVATMALLAFIFPVAVMSKNLPASFVPWSWAALLMMATLISALGAVMLSQIVGTRLLGEGEAIIATPAELRFETRGQVSVIEWRELRAVRLLALRARFETRDGVCEGDWSSGLRPIIERYAPDAALDVASNETDLVLPITQDDGAIFYPFRTEMVRLMLLTHFTPLILPIPIMFAVQYFTPDWDWPVDKSPFFVMVPIMAAGLWLWRLYWRGGIALSEAGLQRRGAWRDRFYRWDEIAQCGGEKDAFWIRVGERRLKLWNWNPPIRKADVEAKIRSRVN